MKIELTLLVQAVNFFIAYIMLDKLLVRPAVSIILEEKKAVGALIEKAQHEAIVLKGFQEKKGAHWEVCEEYFKGQSPQGLPTEIIGLSDGPSIDPEIPSDEELKKVKDQIINVLVKKMQL